MISLKELGMFIGTSVGVLVICAGIASTQSSTQGGGLSTKAIQALEECFDSMGSFTCGGGSGTVGPGTTNTIAKFTGATTIDDSQITDDGTNVTIDTSGSGGDVNLVGTVVNASGTVVSLTPDNLFFVQPSDNSVNFQVNPAPSAGAGGTILQNSAELTAMNGTDTVDILLATVTNANHTGTGNLLHGNNVSNILADPQAVALGNRVGSGWDSFMNAVVDTDGWSADDDPPTNSVALFFDESGADCQLVARLSDGTNVVVATLVAAGDCP